jgi:ribosomal protein L16/L10AE
MTRYIKRGGKIWIRSCHQKSPRAQDGRWKRQPRILRRKGQNWHRSL